MLHTEIKYERLLGLPLHKMVTPSPYLANCRCIYCGDSKKNPWKRRAYVMEKGDILLYFCHNCGVSKSIGMVLKENNPSLYSQYRIETFKEHSNSFMERKSKLEVFLQEKKEEQETSFGVELGTPLLELTGENVAFRYAMDRKIPFKFFRSLFYVDDINKITKQFDKYKEKEFPIYPALVIPYFNKERQFSHLTTRLIGDTPIRYITLHKNDIEQNSIWGLEYLDRSEFAYVTEGQIDAMCLPNAIAIGGSNNKQTIKFVQHFLDKSKVCFIYDNELKTNKYILKEVNARIQDGFNVVLFDDEFRGKDINEVIQNGTMTFDEVEAYIQKRTFSGLAAKLVLSDLLKNITFPESLPRRGGQSEHSKRT